MLRLILAMLLAATPALAAPPKRAAVKPVDWTKTVVATPEGGYRIGNPAAKVALVEYGSLTCSHCRAFHLAGFETLKAKYIASGRLSYEYRSLILNGPDLAAVLLARCDGPAKFFARTDMFYQTQPEWLGKASQISEADAAAVRTAPPEQALVKLVSGIGLDKFAAAHGISAARINACLTDKAALDRVTAMRAAAAKRDVNGTPTFFVNGVRQQDGEGALARPLITWEDLAPRLAAALR